MRLYLIIVGFVVTVIAYTATLANWQTTAASGWTSQILTIVAVGILMALRFIFGDLLPSARWIECYGGRISGWAVVGLVVLLVISHMI